MANSATGLSIFLEKANYSVKLGLLNYVSASKTKLFGQA